MHIPKSETSSLRILSYQDASRLSTDDYYDKSRWLYIPDFYTEYRYVLGTRGRNSVLCVGLNPSTAEPDNLDPTLKSVSRISCSNGFDSWLMYNVYAQRATKPEDMDRNCNTQLHMENLNAFRMLLELVSSQGRAPVIWAAWGAVIEKRPWLMDCIGDLTDLARDFDSVWVCAGKCSKNGHPHHPLYLRRDEKFYPFDINHYLSEKGKQ